MNTQKETSKYNMLVLLDQSKASNKTLKDAVNFAKLIDGNIDILQVKSPTSVVKYENQIASMRSIDEERRTQEMALRSIVSEIKKEEGVAVTSTFTFGNVKNEIREHIEKTNPDIVVLGKRKKKFVGLIGDQVTKDLVNNQALTVLISGSKKGLATFDDKSVGFLNTSNGIEKIALVNDLKQHLKKPLKIFRTVSNVPVVSNDIEPTMMEEQGTKQKDIIYEFDGQNNSVDDMASFISKNNLSLLCVHKNADENKSINGKLDKIITKTIERINIPVLVLNNNLN